jgi:hypothetical protein
LNSMNLSIQRLKKQKKKSPIERSEDPYLTCKEV